MLDPVEGLDTYKVRDWQAQVLGISFQRRIENPVKHPQSPMAMGR